MKATYTLTFRVVHTEDDNPDMPSLNANAMAAQMAEWAMSQASDVVVTPMDARLTSIDTRKQQALDWTLTEHGETLRRLAEHDRSTDRPVAWDGTGPYIGTEGQDHESYTDDQDHESYVVDEDAFRGDR